MQVALRGGRRGLLAPVFDRLRARLGVYVRDALEEPRWAVMFLFGRVLAIRRFLAWRRSRRYRARGWSEPATCELADTPPGDILAGLRRDGLWSGLRLDPSVVRQIRSFAEARPCYAGMDRRYPFLAGDHAEAEARFGRSILVGHFLDDLRACAAAMRLVDDPWLADLASRYLLDPARLVATRLWWSFPSAAPSDRDLSVASQDKYHFDLDDWGQVKIFFYLTDVAVGSGEHCYVRGSHRRRRLGRQISPFVGASTRHVMNTYGSTAIETVVGAAGHGFVEDPFGYHAGKSLRAGRRLVLEISYGLNDLMPRRKYGELTP